MRIQEEGLRICTRSPKMEIKSKSKKIIKSETRALTSWHEAARAKQNTFKNLYLNQMGFSFDRHL